MVVFSSILRPLWNNLPLILHCGVIITLIGVSIWDSTLIINTFINDNRLTVVRTEISNNSSAFLENITIDITSQMLPKQWYEEVEATNMRQSDAYQHVTRALRNGEVSLSSINTSTIEGKLTTLAIQAQLVDMDTTSSLACLIHGKMVCVDETSIYRNLNVILRNATELENIERAVASEIYDYVVGSKNRFNYYSSSISIQSATVFGISIEIDPKTILENNPDGVILLRVNEWIKNETESVGSVNIHAGRSHIHTKFDRKSQYYFALDIKNIGIHDKRETIECTREPQIITRFSNHPDCDARGFLKQIVKKCGCIPFTERMNYRKFRDNPKNIEDAPFCDFQKYFDCSADSGPIKTAARDCLPSCSTIRNQYTLIVNKSPCVDNVDGRCSFATFRIRTPDRSYVVFEDRFQLTPSQFISQLGGDIGLYTGLSVLSIWQVILLVHKRYTKYAGRSGLSSGKRFVVELFKEFAVPKDRLEQSDECTLEEVNQQPKGEWEMGMEKRLIDAMEKGFAKMKEEFASMKSQHETLKRKVSVLEMKMSK